MITLDQLAAHADDDDLRLVYADAALAAGHPRGELVTVQHALAKSPDDLTLAAREAELFVMHPEILLGELADRWDTIDEEREPSARDGAKEVQLAWRLGFIDHARFSLRRDDGGEQLGQLLGALLSQPSGALLRRLDLGVFTWGRDVHFERVTKPLFATLRPALRVLEIGRLVEDGSSWGGPGHVYVDRDISAVYLGALDDVWTAAPQLRELRLHGNLFTLGTPVAPALAVLELCTSSLERAHLQAIARADWPALDRLVLWFGDGEYGGGDSTIDDVVALLDALAAKAPRLAHLALANHPEADAVCRSLVAASPALLARLRGLDLSLGTLSPAGAIELVTHREHLPALAVLNVSDSYLDSDAIAGLEHAFPACQILAGSQQSGRSGRYVRIAE